MEYYEVPWTKHRIAGVYYHKDSNVAVLAEMRRKHSDRQEVLLELFRDPGNRYDKNAIKVLDPETGNLIGWIPKEENMHLAMMMDKLPFKVVARLGPDCSFSANRLSVVLTMKVPHTMDRLQRSSNTEEQPDPTPPKELALLYNYDLDL